MVRTSVLPGVLLGLVLMASPITGCDQGQGEGVCGSGASLYAYGLSDWREEFCRLDSGQIHGPYMRWGLEGNLRISGAFDLGRSDGEWLYYFDGTEQLSKRAGYALDIPHGEWAEYGMDGTLLKEMRFNMGAACGSWREYDGAGALYNEVTYLGCDGEVIGVDPPEGLTMAPKDVDPGWTGLACPVGSVITDVTEDPGARWCQDGGGQRDGPYGRWSAAGEKLVSGAYAAGARTGTWTIWNEEGGVIRRETWAGGVLEGPWWSWAASGMPQEACAYGGGVRDGLWTAWYPHGKRSAEGSYADGEKSGAWTAWWSDGITREESTWSAGLLHGSYTLNFADGKPSTEGTYAGGREEGTWTSYWPNGQIWSEGEYAKGWRQGMWLWWTDDGHPYMEGAYVDQNPVGEWAIYLTDPVLGVSIRLAGPYDGAVRRGPWVGTYVDAGTTESEQLYVDGLMEGPFLSWWPDGTPRAEGTYLTSLAEFTWRFWHQNGQLMAECDFHQGQFHGPCTEWYDTGVKKAEGTYSMGMRVGDWIYWTEDGEETSEAFDGWGYER